MLASAYPCLLPHYGIVAQHLDDRRPLRQQLELIGRPRPELGTVLDDRRVDRDGGRLKAFRQLLVDAGRPRRVTLTAILREHQLLVSALVGDDPFWSSKAA